MSYRVHQPILARLDADAFAPEFFSAWKDGSAEALEAIIHRPTRGVIELPLFAAVYQQSLLRELHAFEQWATQRRVALTRPNTMNQYGVVIEELGLEETLAELVTRFLAPVARHVMPTHGADLDYQHSFLVDYAKEKDRELGFHQDDSEVTLNVCLGLDFAGGDVYFEGERCLGHRDTPTRKGESWAWSPVPGRAILHAGAHRHGVRALDSGRRVNLIVWMKSSRLRREHPRPNEGPAPWCPACG